MTEALARCGVGELTLVDRDVVSISNLNRQIIALESTVGRMKTRVMKERIEEINPNLNVHTREVFFCRKTAIHLHLIRMTMSLMLWIQ